MAEPKSGKRELQTKLLLLAAVGGTVFGVLTAARPPQAQTTTGQGPAAQDKSWITRSNQYAQMLLDISAKHWPEFASRQGLAQFDTEIERPTTQDEEQAYVEWKAVIAKFEAQLPHEQNKDIREDLEIMIKAEELDFKEHDFEIRREVPYLNASEYVFGGLHGLLDDQTSADRRKAALVRLRRYAGLEQGYRPIADILKERTREQMAKANMIYPAKAEVETDLARNANYLQGISALFEKYGITGWEEPFAKLNAQLTDYDVWVRSDLLPKARKDFREPPELYAINLEELGVDIPPAKLAQQAHQAFKDTQAQMQAIALQVAKQHGWPETDYRAVIKRLKQDQLTGEAILPFYKQRLQNIEGIIVRENIATLPKRPARIRLGTAAESVQNPAPHMVAAPTLNNTGEQGEFVLPLNMPAAEGAAGLEKVDDYTYDAASWTMIAHEARPGHELAFDMMVEHGVSHARALYAGNSATSEGWGLYAESILEPYMPADGQLISLQFRLLREARAFLDPELQAGTIKPEDAMRVLTQDAVFSVPFANQEVERYTILSPGQANSYFYGYTQFLQLRKETEDALGPKFDQKKFHDFILGEGMLHLDLLRRAVMQEFIPAQKAMPGR